MKWIRKFIEAYRKRSVGRPLKPPTWVVQDAFAKAMEETFRGAPQKPLPTTE